VKEIHCQMIDCGERERFFLGLTTRMAEHNFKNYDVNTSWKNKFSTKNLRTHHLPSEIKI
jgi:hypothetical protein